MTAVDKSASDKANPTGEARAAKLIAWFNAGAGGKIIWGKPGDFDACVRIAGKHMTPAQARGFCNERHQDATGHPPGKHGPGGAKVRKANAVANRRRALESMKNPPSPARIDVLVDQYRRRLHDYQARTIARTELLWASNAGAHEGHRQAVETGAYPAGVEREWVTAAEGVPYRKGTSRVCVICRPMSGVRVDGLETPFVTPAGAVLFPPAHPACRCRTILIPKGLAA
jgi:hypothetical protein